MIYQTLRTPVFVFSISRKAIFFILSYVSFSDLLMEDEALEKIGQIVRDLKDYQVGELDFNCI